MQQRRTAAREPGSHVYLEETHAAADVPEECGLHARPAAARCDAAGRVGARRDGGGVEAALRRDLLPARHGAGSLGAGRAWSAAGQASGDSRGARQSARAHDGAQRLVVEVGRTARGHDRIGSLGRGGVSHGDQAAQDRRQRRDRRQPDHRSGDREEDRPGHAPPLTAARRRGSELELEQLRRGLQLLVHELDLVDRSADAGKRAGSAHQPAADGAEPADGVRAAVRQRFDAGDSRQAVERESQHPRFDPQRARPAESRPRRRRSPHGRSVHAGDSRNRAPHPDRRGGDGRGSGDRSAARNSRILRRAHQAAFRHDGARVPRRHHPRRDAARRPRSHGAQLRVPEKRALPERRHELELPRGVAPPGRSGADPPLRRHQPLSRLDARLLCREAEVDSRRRRDAARFVADPLRHEHGELEPAPALRRAAHSGRRRKRPAERQPAPGVRSKERDHRQPAAERARLVRHPSGRAGRQHRAAGESRVAHMRVHPLSTFLAAVLIAIAVRPAVAAGKSDVADAMMKGDQAALRTLVQRKADVNAPQVDGATALHWAVYRDDGDSADLLITAGARVDAKNREGVTPLAMASLFGSARMVERLLAGGADAKQKGAAGETMVMLAAHNGNPDVIKRLVGAGADVNATEPLRGTTALMWAAEQRHASAVKMLLELGADHRAKSGPAGLPRNYMAPRVNTAAVKDAQRRYAEAVAAGRSYEEQLEYEASHGAKISLGFRGILNSRRPELNGGAPAPGSPPAPGSSTPPAAAPAAAPRAAPEPAPRTGDDDADVIVAGLVGTGGGGLTPLTFAAREGDVESAKYLLDAGADINQTTEYGWSPLLTATNNRHYKLGAFLLERGANASIANKGGRTPIYLATDNRNIEGGDYPVPKPDLDHLEYLRMLLDHGADPNARAKDNTLTRTIFTMQWFYEAGCTPFVRAAQSSDTALMRLLLEYGADPFMTTDNGDTALTAAGGIGWVEGVTYERSAKENVEAIRMLLDDVGLDPNIANKEGRTALMGAALKGRNEVVEMLVAHGARLDQRDGGSRDTDTNVSAISGHTWQALDYADGLVRVGVQSAVQRPETAALLRKMMTDRGMPVPPANRVIESICVVELCAERQPKK